MSSWTRILRFSNRPPKNKNCKKRAAPKRGSLNSKYEKGLVKVAHLVPIALVRKERPLAARLVSCAVTHEQLDVHLLADVFRTRRPRKVAVVDRRFARPVDAVHEQSNISLVDAAAR